MDKCRLMEQIVARQDELYSLLSELIRFNSENDGCGGNGKGNGNDLLRGIMRGFEARGNGV